MSTLQKMFPSLTLFSDLDWETVTQEYESHYIDLSFPEYLQQKAEDGDCPPYLFELAFYELAHYDVKNSEALFPHQPGIYLNPTALFLSLEFDIKKMLDDASKGTIDVYEKPHVLCLFKDKQDQVHITELGPEELELLQYLEEGPQENLSFISPEHNRHYKELVSRGLIINLIND